MKRRVVAAALSVALVAGAVPAHAGVERPVDDRSSIKPLFELSSPAHSSEHSSMATNEKLREEWAEAARKGFFSPIIESIYGLDIPDGYEERMAAEDGDAPSGGPPSLPEGSARALASQRREAASSLCARRSIASFRRVPWPSMA